MFIKANANKDVYWFSRGQNDNPRFWSRFPVMPSFANAVVMDIGCGRGSMCVYIAELGAKQVIGVDIDPAFVSFARDNLNKNHQRLKGIVEFESKSLEEFPDDYFDYVVSKDAFEHVSDLREVLAAIKRCLKPGGKLYAGFGPLYNSVDGDHGLLGWLPPWGHLLIPEDRLLARLNRKRLERISSIKELGLNQMSYAAYLSVIRDCGLTVKSFCVNQSKNIVSQLFSVIRKIKVFEECCTHNIYCVLQKDA